MTTACRICGNTADNTIHNAREMMFGTRDRFDYLKCGACGTLQLLQIPDMRAYYPEEYYSFGAETEPTFQRLRSRIAAGLMGRSLLTGRGKLGLFLARKRPHIADKFPAWFRQFPSSLSLDSSILDFGSGSGALLQTLRSFGFRNLTGADAFIEKDIDSGKIKIFKQGLEEVGGQFDLVMLHHTFEHLPEPHTALRHIHRLTKPNGAALIRIPIVSYAWEKYGVDWVQLDPPRHVFLYTEHAFVSMIEQAGFEVVRITYDSEAFQFHGSEQYRMDIPMNDPRTFRGACEGSIFTQEQYDEWVRLAEKLNTEARGDQACFYLRKR